MDQREAMLLIRTYVNEPVMARFLVGWLLARCSELEVLAALDAVRTLDESRQAQESELIAKQAQQPPLL